jgi:hypothetical protein
MQLVGCIEFLKVISGALHRSAKFKLTKCFREKEKDRRPWVQVQRHRSLHATHANKTKSTGRSGKKLSPHAKQIASAKTDSIWRRVFFYGDVLSRQINTNHEFPRAQAQRYPRRGETPTTSVPPPNPSRTIQRSLGATASPTTRSPRRASHPTTCRCPNRRSGPLAPGLPRVPPALENIGS